jgi:hypothetical protein
LGISTKTAAAAPAVSAEHEALSPHGFADDEDGEAPDIEQRNEALLAAQARSSATPNPRHRQSWVRFIISYMDQTIIPNYWEYAYEFTLCDNFFSSITNRRGWLFIGGTFFDQTLDFPFARYTDSSPSVTLCRSSMSSVAFAPKATKHVARTNNKKDILN